MNYIKQTLFMMGLFTIFSINSVVQKPSYETLAQDMEKLTKGILSGLEAYANRVHNELIDIASKQKVQEPSSTYAPLLEKFVAQLKGKLGEIIKEYGDFRGNEINNLNEFAQKITGYEPKIEKQRQLLFSILPRTEPNLYSSLQSTYLANWQKVPVQYQKINIKKIYKLLGLSTEQGLRESVQNIKNRISKLNVPDAEKLKRQLDFIFANEYAKQNYDTYLLQSVFPEKNAIKDIQLGNSQQELLSTLSREISETKALINDLVKFINIKITL